GCVVTNVTSVPALGSPLPVGTNSVTTTIRDSEGGTKTCVFSVIVVDNDPPSIICPTNIVTGNDPGQCSAHVEFGLPVGSDGCGVASVVAAPPSGSLFPIGTNPVLVVITDIHGNTNSCVFTVTVEDREPPVITHCPTNRTVAGCHTIVPDLTPEVAATDNCS